MAQTPIIESLHDGGFLVSEGNGHRARDPITMLSGAKYLAGLVLGQITIGAVSSAAKAGGNTGNGTFVLDGATPALVGCKVGIYTLRCIAAAANSGTFRLEDPDGFVLGDFTITGGAGGTVLVNDDIKGVLTDAATDFVVGDGFDVTVAAGSGKGVAYDPAGLDGRQNVAGVLFGTVDATLADKKATNIARAAEVNASELVWGAGVTTTPQKTAALAALAKIGVISR